MKRLLIPFSLFMISIFVSQANMIVKNFPVYESMIWRLESVLLIGLLLSSSAWAIVDVNDQYFAEPDATVFSSLSFDLNGASGNDNRSSFGIDSHTLFRGDKSTWLLIGSYQAEQSEGRDTVDNAFVHVRYVRKLATGGVEFYVQGQRDRFQKLDSRRLFGAGYRFDWQNSEGNIDALIGIGVMQEQERFVDVAAQESRSRANIYLTLSMPIGQTRQTRWSLSAFAQPGLSAGGMRSIAVTKIVTKLTDKLSLDLSLAYDHDSQPTYGVNSDNFRYTSGLTYTFRKSEE
ncbi:MAG: DUF481 domain-containing protein [Gammaproteobacteria bacterium]|jgi:hypothetical protein|nr:DUF481 domain-containing protein [Gammaproteobacteria bacterium]MBT5205238.1 DUF481 domain-containing protein [Gammaproteobacteria bacterium]MBT5601433.1 DUF481 domain-containing protein [Gammaproteobacteria bacterium]MBT6245949.1 DUF481 domain-containing protein [Gammaproteobacteria bacterium]